MSVLRSTTGRTRLARGVVTLRLALGAAIGGTLLSGAPVLAQAQGQVASVEPYYVVVLGDEGVLRCGNLDTFYVVANLRGGQVLRVDGESENWKRVAYPQGTAVFVSPDDVQVAADGKSVTLTRPSNLKAANAGRSGLKGSWKNVFDPTPLPVGARLTVVKLEQTDDGKKQAYRVEAPEGARAFVHHGYVRKASDAEVLGAGFTLAGPSSTDGGVPVAANPATPAGGGRGATDLTGPQVKSSDSSVALKPTTAIDPDGPVVGEAGPNGERAIATPEQLSVAFEDVRRQPTVTAELDELIVEYQRTIDERVDRGADQRVTRALLQRQELLRLRKDLQAQMVALEEARKSAGDAGRDAAAQLADVNKTRHYEVIGRLTTSTVYDGKTLPRMYRVQSVGDAVARTLGYLRPDEKLELEKKIGQIVGVAGEATMDGALKLNVLTASRVDVLSANEQTVGAPENN